MKSRYATVRHDIISEIRSLRLRSQYIVLQPVIVDVCEANSFLCWFTAFCFTEHPGGPSQRAEAD